jgi:putative NADH-flavin reductase
MNPRQSLLIFGATGTLGRVLAQQALNNGHRVTTFARTPSQLEAQHGRAVHVQGDVLDPGAVARAVEGQDAVLCTLGNGRQGMVRATGTANIVRAMQRAHVQRLICQTTLGVGDSWANLNFFWKHVMFGGLLRPAFADHVEQERHVMQSSLAWTLVRPATFTNGPLTKTYRHGFASSERVALKISRADVAHFMLRELDDGHYLHRAVSLSDGA